MSNVTDLEQEILAAWNVVEDIKTIYENVLNNESMTKDDIANVLLGLSILYGMKFQKAFDTFESLVKEYYGCRKNPGSFDETP